MRPLLILTELVHEFAGLLKDCLSYSYKIIKNKTADALNVDIFKQKRTSMSSMRTSDASHMNEQAVIMGIRNLVLSIILIIAYRIKMEKTSGLDNIHLFIENPKVVAHTLYSLRRY